MVICRLDDARENAGIDDPKDARHAFDDRINQSLVSKAHVFAIRTNHIKRAVILR